MITGRQQLILSVVFVFQLIFEEFRVGTLYVGQCIGGEMQILELGRPYVGGSWCGTGPAEGSAPAVYYSEAGTVTLTLRVPYSGQYIALPFAFALRFKFLDNRHAAVRLGSAAEPKERGELVPGTRCSQNFYECYRKRCSLQSPNYPGLYPRNVTCHYTVRQKVVPKCKHAMVSVGQQGRAVTAIGQQPPLSAATRSRPSPLKNGTAVIRVNDMCFGTEDRLVFYDGPSEQDPVLLTFCGGPALPRVVASGPVMLVVFRSWEHNSPATFSSPPPVSRLRSFELDTYIAFVDSDSLDYVRGAACEFVINASTAAGRSPRQGVLVSPQHSVPANSTCTYRFQGQPDDRVWMYFETYGHRSTNNFFTFKPCPTRLRIWDGDGTLLGDHCDTPRLCEHYVLDAATAMAGATSNATRPKRPCTLDESYLSKSSSVILQVHSVLGTVLEPFGFKMHYEFVDSGAYDRENGGGACVIRYKVRKSMDITEPKNVFLYGRGGAKNLDCLYRLEVEPGYRMQIVVRNASFGSSPRECAAPVTKTAAGKFTCPDGGDRGQSPKLIVREVFWRSVKIERGCFCQNFTEAALGAQRVTFDPSSDTVEIQFRVSDFGVTEDFTNTYFNVHVRVLRSPPCPRKQWIRGSGGEIELAYPLETRDDLYCHDKPWLLEAHPDHSMFVQTWGRFLPPNASTSSVVATPCKTRNRILLYALRPVRLIRHVCPADGRDNRHNVYMFSDEWTDFVPADHQNPSFMVEFLALEPGSMAFKWLEVSKPKHLPPSRSPPPLSDRNDINQSDDLQLQHHRFGCAYGCPELNACISATLWCDGHRNCPSGVDEADLNCQTKWPSFKVLRSYGLPVAGVALAGTVFALLAWIFCGRRGPDDYRHYDDEPAAEPATADNTRSCSSIAS